MTTTTIDLTMRENFTRFDGVFGAECYRYATLIVLANGRYLVRLGDASRPCYGFTYRSQAERFLQEKNAEGKAEVARKIEAGASSASGS